MDLDITKSEIGQLSKALKKIEDLKELKVRQNELFRAIPYLDKKYYQRRKDGLELKERKLNVPKDA